MGIEPKPYYFDEWQNPDDPTQTYYKYNGLYFEKDSKDRNWSRLPDLYTENLPAEIAEFAQQNAKQKPEKEGKTKK
jgi:hypothetical protein